MKKIQNHLKTNGWKAQKSAPEGLLLFLVFLLTIQLFSCGQVVGWTDTDETAPSVKFVTPADDSTGVALNASISATFSETMDSSTFSTSSFTLFKGTTAVTGAVVYSGETAIFTPGIILDPETEYVATVTNKVKDLAGNFLAQDFEWKFTTGETPETVPPEVIATIPFGDATGAALDTEISAVFSETMNPLTITENNFTLLDGTTPVEGTVSYVGVTATFVPENNLDQNKLYTATIHTGVTDIAGNGMTDNYTWSFTTGDTIDDVRPEITSTFPKDGDIEITLDSTVSAIFSEAMNPLTINSATFILKYGTTIIEGSIFIIGNRVVFDPENDLMAETEYTATVTSLVTDLAGNTMEDDFVWKFTTGKDLTLLPPVIISTIPLDEAIDVSIDTDISAEFSKEMDILTITDLTFLVTDDLLAPVDGIVAYDVLTKTATFTPDNDLELDTEYTVTITTGVEDLAGIAMEMDFVWTFTTDTAPTVISTIPLDGATDVAIDTEISAEFSEDMNGLTITDMTFLVTDDSLASVDGMVDYDALTKTVTFTPDSDLLLDTEYTATITADVENLTGTSMEMDFVWTFSTGAGTVDLKLISPFAIASAAGIDNTGATHINGDVVLDPNFTCNDVPGVHDGGFGLCDGKAPTINGTVITNQYPDTVTSAAILADLTAAYLSIMKANLPGAIVLGCGTIGSNGDAGALIGCAGNSTLAPGVYISSSDSSIGITGILTLDGQGDNNAEFIFQAPSSTLVTASGAAGFPLSEIRLINGARASNVWWQVGSSATIGAYSIFQGNILADSSITMETGATSCGRLLAGAFTTSGAFIFDSNLVSVPGNGCPK